MQSKLAIPRCLTEKNLGIVLLDYQDQTTIYHGTDAFSSIWIVKQGYVKLHRASVQGRQATLSVLGRGAVFGTIEADQSASGEMASAQGDTQAYRIELDIFDKLLSSDVEFSRFITRSLCRRKDALQRRLFYVMHRKVESRLAAVLSDLVDNEGERCIHGCDVDARLTQQDLADMVGASRQVVSSALNRLRERNIVQYSRDFICVCDMPTLTSLAES
jgi:CRP-like cAMP-binding protein